MIRRSFFGYRPAPRSDAPWPSLRIDEATTSNGPWTAIDTIALNPLDTDPVHPQLRSFSTDHATLQHGWYRIVFFDDTGESAAEPVYYSGQEGTRPSVDEVALLLRTRTVGGGTLALGLGADTGPGDLTTFTTTTRPNIFEVDRVIEMATRFVIGRLPAGIIPSQAVGAVRHSIALYAAILIEISFFREQPNDSLTSLRDLYDQAISQVEEAYTSETAVPLPAGAPRYAWGSIPMTTDRVVVPPDPNPF